MQRTATANGKRQPLKSASSSIEGRGRPATAAGGNGRLNNQYFDGERGRKTGFIPKRTNSSQENQGVRRDSHGMENIDNYFNPDEPTIDHLDEEEDLRDDDQEGEDEEELEEEQDEEDYDEERGQGQYYQRQQSSSNSIQSRPLLSRTPPAIGSSAAKGRFQIGSSNKGGPPQYVPISSPKKRQASVPVRTEIVYMEQQPMQPQPILMTMATPGPSTSYVQHHIPASLPVRRSVGGGSGMYREEVQYVQQPQSQYHQQRMHASSPLYKTVVTSSPHPHQQQQRYVQQPQQMYVEEEVYVEEYDDEQLMEEEEPSYQRQQHRPAQNRPRAQGQSRVIHSPQPQRPVSRISSSQRPQQQRAQQQQRGRPSTNGRSSTSGRSSVGGDPNIRVRPVPLAIEAPPPKTSISTPKAVVTSPKTSKKSATPKSIAKDDSEPADSEDDSSDNSSVEGDIRQRLLGLSVPKTFLARPPTSTLTVEEVVIAPSPPDAEPESPIITSKPAEELASKTSRKSTTTASILPVIEEELPVPPTAPFSTSKPDDSSIAFTDFNPPALTVEEVDAEMEKASNDTTAMAAEPDKIAPASSSSKSTSSKTKTSLPKANSKALNIKSIDDSPMNESLLNDSPTNDAPLNDSQMNGSLLAYPNVATTADETVDSAPFNLFAEENAFGDINDDGPDYQDQQQSEEGEQSDDKVEEEVVVVKTKGKGKKAANPKRIVLEESDDEEGGVDQVGPEENREDDDAEENQEEEDAEVVVLKKKSSRSKEKKSSRKQNADKSSVGQAISHNSGKPAGSVKWKKELVDHEVVVPVEHEYFEDEDGARRSKRARIAPIAYWKNERAVYDRRESGIALKDVIRIVSDEDRPRKTSSSTRTKKQTKVKKERQRKGQHSYDEHDMHDHIPPPPPEILVINYATKSEEFQRIAVTPEILDTSSRTVAAGEYKFQKVFSEGEFMASGVLDLPVGACKPSKNSHSSAMVFIVMSGFVEVKVHQTSFQLLQGGQFFVPRGNQYCITNVGDVDSKLIFCHGKMIV